MTSDFFLGSSGSTISRSLTALSRLSSISLHSCLAKTF